MSLSTTQFSPLVLRNRTISRHTNHEVKPPRLDEINNHVDNYIRRIKPSVISLSFDQQIHYWSSKITEHVHVCIDILLPDFNNFTHIVMLRWLTIGYSIYQLIQIWKTYKHNIKTHTRVTDWLPDIVKKKLPPNLLRVCSYNQLRKYVRMWENRELITALPKLRGEHTHRLNEMNDWIREFDQKVALIAEQRDIRVPDSIKEQIKLYKVYLEHHSQPEQSDDENDTCEALDDVVSEYLPGILDDDSSDDNKEDDEEQDISESDLEIEEPQVSRKDLQMMKYRDTIKKLKDELRQTKKSLDTTRFLHCKAAREQHVYREMVKHHKTEIDELHEEIKRKNEILVRLKQAVAKLKDTLQRTKAFLKRTQLQFMESRKLIEKLLKKNRDETTIERSIELLNESRICTNSMSPYIVQQDNSPYNLKLNGYTVYMNDDEDDDIHDRDSVSSDDLLCASSSSSEQDNEYLPGIEEAEGSDDNINSDYNMTDNAT